ncbi:MAG TPA: MFS transporter, partial [Puia sp.]|nr:MFS transporter [Puia sp.]
GALKHRNLLMGIIAIFTYVGGEVSIGSLLIGYLKLPAIAGLPEAEGSRYVAVYWGGLMTGRFIGALSLNANIPSRYKYTGMCLIPMLAFLIVGNLLSWEAARYLAFFLVLNLLAFFFGNFLPDRTLGIFSVIQVCLLLTAIGCSGRIAMWSLIAAGLFNSICWSNIFALSLKGLGKYTGQGSSLLIMAILGAAVIPVIQGGLADRIGLQYSFIIPVICYLYLAIYGFRWYRDKSVPDLSD